MTNDKKHSANCKDSNKTAHYKDYSDATLCYFNSVRGTGGIHQELSYISEIDQYFTGLFSGLPYILKLFHSEPFCLHHLTAHKQ